jgi:ADP-ribose pyrophosphatase YjhB (NUDIX family)
MYKENRFQRKQQIKQNIICNNCRKIGHLFKHCRQPVTSYGVIQFRINEQTLQREYLMICRKDTLGYIDFLRGKYCTQDKQYIINMMIQMTNDEKNRILNLEFHELWKGLWNKGNLQLYKAEEEISYVKFQYLKSKTGTNNYSKQRLKNCYISHDDKEQNGISELASLINESNKSPTWIEPEWGFPKGRRNHLEKDYQCALREMTEETGYNIHDMINLKNVLPFEEVFIGSNYKTYKHKYYLMFMKYQNSQLNNNYDNTEISSMEWNTYDVSVSKIRSYNYEKIKMFSQVENTLSKYWI